MFFKIKNIKLALVALVTFLLLLSLGFWQLQRAEEKQRLLTAFNEHSQRNPLTATDLQQNQDWEFYRATLTGEFLNDKTVLLDNKLFHGRIGYEVFTPFRLSLSQVILIDRGFLPQTANGRATLPLVKKIPGEITVTGFLKRPSKYVSLGKMVDAMPHESLFRIEFIDLNQLKALLKQPHLAPYLLVLAPNDPSAYPIEWRIITMGPERHIGYAVQWFALALTLLVIFVALNRGRST